MGFSVSLVRLGVLVEFGFSCWEGRVAGLVRFFVGVFY